MALKKKIAIFLASIAPGIFLIGYNVGTGSITTMASAGAAYHMELMWPLLLSCIFTYFLIISFGKYTAITGKTILHSTRTYINKPLAIFILIAFLVSEGTSCMGLMGIISEIIQEWTKPLTPSGNGLSPIITSVIFGGLLFYLFWNGKQRFFEKILGIFVSLMGVCFIATMFMVVPDGKSVIEGLIPRLPDSSEKMFITAGMVGTTMGSILYVVRSILVQERGWKAKDLHLERRDAMISAAIMFVLSISIMATAAGTLHPLGLKVENALDMVMLMEPIAGRFAVSLFVAGIVSAGLSSLFPILLLAPWLFADYNDKPRNMTSKSSRLMVLAGILISFTIPLFGGRPVFIMILSQVLGIVVTPLVLGIMLVLMNKKDLMGEYAATKTWNISMVFILAFATYIAINGILGVIQML